MYEYRKLTPEERKKVVEERIARGYPPHRPPHPHDAETFYLLTAACYEHKPIIHSPERRQSLLDQLFAEFIAAGMEIRAWVVLQNHYHLLTYVTDFEQLQGVFQQIHGSTAYTWNGEDNARGRKVWYRYTDRMIRSERHYYTTLNYIHYNPVKHGVADSPYDWTWSSVHWYLEHEGREWLRDAWVRYPVRDYGKGWDDFDGA